MKRRARMLLHVLCYIGMILIMAQFDVKRLIDLKSMLLLAAGTLLLALPFYEKKMGRGNFLFLVGQKAVDAGWIQTFLLLFIRLSDEKGYEALLPDTALCFRPLLYAFCIRLICDRENKEEDTPEENLTEEEKLREENLTEEENLQKDPGEAILAERSGSFSGKDPGICMEDCMAVGLTRREAEVALMVCRGCSNGEIAEEFVISQTTVKKHMSNIFEKTGVKKREELKGYIAGRKQD